MTKKWAKELANIILEMHSQRARAIINLDTIADEFDMEQIEEP
jgi:hypothetical protein